MKKPEITIRRGKTQDFPRILELWLEMIEYHEKIDKRFETSAGRDQAYLNYLEEIVNHYDYNLILAERNGEVVGYTIAAIMSNQALFALPHYGFIAEMAVKENIRSQGIGQALWEAARAWCKRRGVTVMQLNVSKLNKRAQKFWRRLGCRDFLDILWYDIPES